MELPVLANKLSGLKGPVVMEMMEEARSLEANGRRIIHLVRGEPDFDTPHHIREAAKEALDQGYTHYPPIRGYQELREAVAGKLEVENGLFADPDGEVLITTGATMGMFIALAAILNPGDEVLLPDPIYDPYANLIRFLNCMPVFIPTILDGDRFRLDLNATVKRLSSRTKALVVNNPWNPTGTVLETEELETVASLAEGNNLYLVMDEIYEKLVYPGHSHQSIVSLIPDIRHRTITVNSLSKTYAMTGWRVGYNVAPQPLTRAMLRVYQQCSRGPAAFVQRAAIAAFKGPQECISRMQEEYTTRRELMVGGLSAIKKFRPVVPEGTFFVFTRLRNEDVDSRKLAMAILNEAGVLVTPGSAFGSCGEGYLRFSFATSQETIKEGIRAVAEYMSATR